MATRIVFMGSPDFALPTLEELNKRYNVVGVVTQPDRPVGRGRQMQPPPVKNMALLLEIPIIQPSSLKIPKVQREIGGWKPDLIVVAAFGQILPTTILNIPSSGCINVHASLLPRWRGASPIQSAIAAGDERTGVTIMRMEAGLDTGPILTQRDVPIRPGTIGSELSNQLAFLGAKTLLDILPSYLNGMLAPMPQEESLVTYAPMLKKADGLLDFSQDAQSLVRKIHAYQPWPGTFFIHNDKQIKVSDAHAHDTYNSRIGEHYILNNYPAVGTSNGFLVLDQLQPEGKKTMRGSDFLNGQSNWL